MEEEVALISKWSEGRGSWSWLKVEKWSGALLCDILSAHRPNTHFQPPSWIKDNGTSVLWLQTSVLTRRGPETGYKRSRKGKGPRKEGESRILALKLNTGVCRNPPLDRL